ncbi:putative beta-lactamase domain-containing protein 2 [Balamuthia mandrillaris]
MTERRTQHSDHKNHGSRLRLLALCSLLLCSLLGVVLAYPKVLFNPKPNHSFACFVGLTECSNVPVRGKWREDFAAVRERFRRNFEEFDEVGAAVVVYVNGEKVVDLWAGVAKPSEDGSGYDEWRKDTLVNVFSTGKGVANLCIAKLVADGRLDYDTAVAYYWPEFAQEGKENITLGQLLRHEAGLAVIDDPLYDDLTFLQEATTSTELGDLLAKQKPNWKVTEGVHGYHAISRDFFLSQLIRRVDVKGRGMDEFFREEIAEPFGIDFHFRLDEKHHHRTAQLVPRPKLWAAIESLSPYLFEEQFWGSEFFNELMDSSSLSYGAFTRPTALNGAMNLAMYDTTEIRSLEAPSCAGIGSADGLAKLYHLVALGSSSSSFLPPSLNSSSSFGFSKSLQELLLEETKPVKFSKDVILKSEAAFTRGGWVKLKPDWHVIGSCGYGGSLAFADLDRRMSFAYVMNMMGAVDPQELWLDKRAMALVESVYQVLEENDKQKAPLSEKEATRTTKTKIQMAVSGMERDSWMRL